MQSSELSNSLSEADFVKDFEDLVDIYSMKNTYCGNQGYLYKERNHSLDPVFCDSFRCGFCRDNHLKYHLYANTKELVRSNKLFRHFVITCNGKEFRDSISWYDSYKYMAGVWNKFKKVIIYNYFKKPESKFFGDKLSYIAFPRAQSKSGYCHYHILLSHYIDWKFLNETRKKYNSGYVSITYNDGDPSQYVNMKHFFKDREYCIPISSKHYTSSRDIHIRKIGGSFDNDWKKTSFYFKYANNGIPMVDQLYSAVNDFNGYPPPFSELVYFFQQTAFS